MYKTVEQSALLYGRDIWMVTGEIHNVLEGFHHRLAQHIIILTEKHGAGAEWEFP